MPSSGDKPDGEQPKRKNHRIPPRMTDRARELRRRSTFPEILLWSRLRGGRAAGLKFRRQHVLGPYVTDFCCPAAWLVVELDGRSHDNTQEADAERTRYLEEKGYEVIRFTNDDVLRDVNAVVVSICRAAGIET
ncbi:MAG: DUF559 domain-containing protein [Planctomycetota bacterium]